MKRNIIKGIVLIGALALGSCSTTQLASNMKDKDDDVYFSNAKAGDQIEYVASTQPVANQQNRYNNYNDDDYYYYDSYASRINRFGYFSPFNYYNDIYYGYSPYSYYSPYNSWNLGLGLGLGFGGYYGYNSWYSPFSYGYYGYPYYGYNYFGTGYAYGGGGGFWGTYSANVSTGAARPYRSQMPNVPGAAGGRSYTNPRIGYNGNYPNTYMTRPTRAGEANSQATRVNSTGSRGQSSTDYGRPQRPTVQDQPRQTYQPQPQVERSSPPPSMGSSDGGRSSSAGSSNSGGGGGGRPVRP